MAQQPKQVHVMADGTILAVHDKEQLVPADALSATNVVWVDPVNLPAGGIMSIDPINFVPTMYSMNDVQPGWTPSTHQLPLTLTCPAGAGMRALNDINKLAAAITAINSISDASQQRVASAKFYNQDWVRSDTFWDDVMVPALSITTLQMDDVFRAALNKIGVSDG